MGKPKQARRGSRALREAASAIYRDAIIDAAEQLFASGYETAKIADIAEAAALAPATLYTYFASKESIVCALFERLSEQLGTEIDEALASVDDASVLPAFVVGSLTFFDRHPAMFGLLEVRGISSPEIHTALEAVQTTYFERVARVVARATKAGVLGTVHDDSDQVAMIVGIIGTVARMRSRRRSGTPLVEAAPSIVDCIVHGLGRRTV